MTLIHQKWVVKQFAENFISEQNFEWQENKISPLEEGQILVKVMYLSLDPTNRLWLSGKETYFPPLQIGEVMWGGGIGKVIESRNSTFKVGDLVTGLLGWQNYYVGNGIENGMGINILPQSPTIPLTVYMEVFSLTSFTAHYGLLGIGNPQTGETVVVSAAAGAVGSVVGQIAKIKGCRVIGLAGSDQKCKWLKDIGFDEAINYKTENIDQKLKDYCPSGIDIYFDNVGGKILDIVLGQMNVNGRIPICGLISNYNEPNPQFVSQNFGNILIKRLSLRGFIIIDHLEKTEQAFQEMATWYGEGKLEFRTDIVQDLKNAPIAINKLFNGTNTGKLFIQISD